MDSQTGRRMSTISTEEVITLQGEFFGLDKDGNGEISTEELGTLLRSMRIKLGLSEFDIQRALIQIDKDGDGTVDVAELNSVIQRYDTDGIIYKALSQRSQIRKDFERYDADRSGFITRDELVHVVHERTGILVPQKHLGRMMQDCDDNDDGQLNYEEFCTLMTKSFMRKRSVTATSQVPEIKEEDKPVVDTTSSSLEKLEKYGDLFKKRKSEKSVKKFPEKIC